MMYLYHFVPKKMVGTILYPLNTLRDTLPEVFKQQAEKYQGREWVKETDIPGLGKWNDVIHLSPIEPSETRQALQDADPVKDRTWKVFCIDANTLDKSRLIIKTIVNNKGVYIPFTEENYANHCHLPSRTKAYYKQCTEEGRQILIYAYAPHVLYGGTIDIAKTEIREYSN